MIDARPRLPLPCVMLVTDRHLCGERSLCDLVEAAVDGGVGIVQIREKDLPGGELYDLVDRIKTKLGSRALVLVNERLDVALAAHADGVELPSSAIPVEAARPLVPNLLLGRSVHELGDAAEAAARGADLLVVGTIFASQSHPGGPTVGPSLLRKLSASVHIPLIGIGGITAANAGQVIGAGASGVAVVREILDALDPRAAAARLVAAVQDAWPTAPLHRRH